MNKMKFYFSTGMIEIDNQNLILGNYEEFIGSIFFSMFEKKIKSLGKYYYLLENVEWEKKKFLLEIRPSINNFSPLIYLSRKYERDEMVCLKSDTDMSHIYNEEIYLIDWLEKLQGKKGTTFSSNPSGVAWDYPWGSLIVQSNEKSFSCGIYIVWNR